MHPKIGMQRTGVPPELPCVEAADCVAFPPVTVVAAATPGGGIAAGWTGAPAVATMSSASPTTTRSGTAPSASGKILS
ncbi:MAG: hypothetical protein JRM80_12745 [Nitrososphaerota archaeon]|nr:hypothetical protein [Nitrososphaerota archaeon]MDG6990692.1 hypothetical protein [Nitrososphaerota archaeon]